MIKTLEEVAEIPMITTSRIYKAAYTAYMIEDEYKKDRFNRILRIALSWDNREIESSLDYYEVTTFRYWLINVESDLKHMKSELVDQLMLKLVPEEFKIAKEAGKFKNIHKYVEVLSVNLTEQNDRFQNIFRKGTESLYQ